MISFCLWTRGKKQRELGKGGVRKERKGKGKVRRKATRIWKWRKGWRERGRRGDGKGVKGAYANEEWMGRKEVEESVMGCKICIMEMGNSGWERRDLGGREKRKLKE